ncbi:hypothetical protein DKE45_013980 [Acinetobacter pittii]|nr:hypothetical protein DKE45_013980 [Acinetobacter pittii]
MIFKTQAKHNPLDHFFVKVKIIIKFISLLIFKYFVTFQEGNKVLNIKIVLCIFNNYNSYKIKQHAPN